MSAFLKRPRIVATAAALAPLLLLLFPPIYCETVKREYFCEDVKKPFFSVSPAGEGLAKVRSVRPRSIPAEFLMPKPDKTARIFIVGESVAGMLGRGDHYLGLFLGRSFPGKTVEIINAGMPTYESRRILSVFEETLKYDPDLIIVLSGNNEAGSDFCPGFNAEIGRRVRKIKTRLSALSMPREDAEAEISVSIHEERLREMAALATKKRIPALFCTLPVNLRDFAPSGDPPGGLAAGIRLSYGKDPEAALRVFGSKSINPREPFSLFYSGRAQEKLGMPAEAAKSYEAAVKYDAAFGRCSAGRNAMIRRVAAEEGGCLAELAGAFSGIARDGITRGEEIADGVHWFRKYGPFVSAVIGSAAQNCLSAGGIEKVPEPKLLLPEPGYTPEDFSLVLSYAGAYAQEQEPGRISERTVVMLERLCRMNCVKLQRLLLDPEAMKKEIIESEWSPSLAAGLADWRPALLRSAEEMFLRTGRRAAASGAAGAVPLADKAGHPVKSLSPARPLREGEAEAKSLSDLAVKKITDGDLAGARPLLAEAVLKDGDNLEVRLNACYLAARLKDAVFGEEHCGDAVSLSAYPPKHSARLIDGESMALYLRAGFRFETGNKSACDDLRKAIKLASPSWSLTAEAAGQRAKNCPQ